MSSCAMRSTPIWFAPRSGSEGRASTPLFAMRSVHDDRSGPTDLTPHRHRWVVTQENAIITNAALLRRAARVPVAFGLKSSSRRTIETRAGVYERHVTPPLEASASSYRDATPKRDVGT